MAGGPLFLGFGAGNRTSVRGTSLGFLVPSPSLCPLPALFHPLQNDEDLGQSRPEHTLKGTDSQGQILF